MAPLPGANRTAGTLARAAGCIASGTLAFGVIEAMFPGAGAAAQAATGTATAALPAIAGKASEVLAGTYLGYVFSSIATGQEAKQDAAANYVEREHHRDFNDDIELAFGRAMAKVARSWGTEHEPPLSDLAEALAAAFEATGGGEPPTWLTVADAVSVEIKEATLRDLCLNHGELPEGERFLQDDEWRAFLVRLVEDSEHLEGLEAYEPLWTSLIAHLEARFPQQFYRDIKEAFGDPDHQRAWAAMQLRILALIVEQSTLAAESAAKAADNSEAAREQAAQTHKQIRRLHSDMSVQFDAIWKQLDTDDKPWAGELYARLGAKLDKTNSLLEGIAADLTEIKPVVTQGAADSKRAADNTDGLKQGFDSLRGEVSSAISSGAPVPAKRRSTVPTPSSTFIARAGLTARVHTELSKEPEKVVLRQAVTRAMGGYGKTVLAILYAHEYAEHYPGGRYFLSVEGGDIVQALAGLVVPLGLDSRNDPAADAAAVKGLLEDEPASLLILDNVASTDAWQAMLKTGAVPRGHCRVLVTTRDPDLGGADAIPVGRLTGEEARTVYRSFCKDRATNQDHPDAQPSDEIADAVTEWLGGLAVAVAAVAALMKLKPHLSWEHYWRGDGDQWAGLANAGLDQLPDVRPEVAEQLGINGEALEAHRRTLRVIDDAIEAMPPAERRAVEYAALLPQDMAPALWLAALLEADGARENGSLELRLISDPLEQGNGGQEVLARLAKLDVLLPAGEDGRLLSLHRLWHARLNNRDNEQAGSVAPFYDSMELWLLDCLNDEEQTWPFELDWPQAIALHTVARRLNRTGRTLVAGTVQHLLSTTVPHLGAATGEFSQHAESVLAFCRIG